MKTEDFKKVFWVFNRLNFSIIPSYYSSGVLPSNILNSSKLVFLKEHDPEKTLDSIDCKVLVFLKAFDNAPLSLAKSAKRRGIKIISVFDDWYKENTERTNFNYPLAILSDVILVKTISAAQEIKNNFNFEAKVMPDPLRFKKNKIFEINKKNLSICWFGTHNNHDTIINELKNFNKITLPLHLTIITNYINNLYEKIKSFDKNNLKISIKEWHTNADLDIVKNDVVIIPYPSDKKRYVKSSNRIIDSLNLGRFTILSPVQQFNEFKNFVFFGDIVDGILWFNQNKLIAKDKTLLGQRYVEENYSLEKISQKWINILSKIS